MFARLLNIKHWDHIYISIQTLYSVLCWSTFGRDYSLESSWVWHYKLGTPVFGEFLPYYYAYLLNLCQVGWGVSLHSYFQVSPEMIDQFKSGFWRGLSRTFRNLSRSHSCVVLAVCLGSLSSWKVNLHPSLRSWVIWSRFLSGISLYFSPSSFPSTLTGLLASEKHPHSMMLAPRFTVGIQTFRILFLMVWVL